MQPCQFEQSKPEKMPALEVRNEKCGKINAGFWILCDMCEKWFHGQCLNITPPEVERIEQYKLVRGFEVS